MPRLLAIATLALALAACSSDSNCPPDDEATIAVSDNTFGPADLDVTTGTTVTWEWEGAAAHNVTWVAGSPAASATQTTGTYERLFNAAGTFDYYCTIHGTATTGMK